MHPSGPPAEGTSTERGSRTSMKKAVAEADPVVRETTHPSGPPTEGTSTERGSRRVLQFSSMAGYSLSDR